MLGQLNNNRVRGYASLDLVQIDTRSKHSIRGTREDLVSRDVHGQDGRNVSTQGNYASIRKAIRNVHRRGTDIGVFCPDAIPSTVDIITEDSLDRDVIQVS